MVYDEGFEVAIDKQRVCFLFSSTVAVVTFFMSSLLFLIANT